MVKITDYLHVIDPLLKKRDQSACHLNEVEYLIKYKDTLLDENEKCNYKRKEDL